MVFFLGGNEWNPFSNECCRMGKKGCEVAGRWGSPPESYQGAVADSGN